MPSSRNRKNLLFTKVPRHIRDRIYSHAFRHQAFYNPKDDQSRSVVFMNGINSRMLGLLLAPVTTCRQMYEETIGFVYKVNTLLFFNEKSLLVFLERLLAFEDDGKRAAAIRSVAVKIVHESQTLLSFNEVKHALFLLRDTCPCLRELILVNYTTKTWRHWRLTSGCPVVFEMHGFKHVDVRFALEPLMRRRVMHTEHPSPQKWAKAFAAPPNSEILADATRSMRRNSVYDCLISKKTTGSLLLALPPELRNQIYEHCFQINPHAPTRWVLVGPRFYGFDSSNSIISNRYSVLDILLTCYQIYSEAVGLFYRLNTLLFNDFEDLRLFLESISPKRALDGYHRRILATRKRSIVSIAVCPFGRMHGPDSRAAKLTKRLNERLSGCNRLKRLVIIEDADEDCLLSRQNLLKPLAGVRSIRVTEPTLTTWSKDIGSLDLVKYQDAVESAARKMIRR